MIKRFPLIAAGLATAGLLAAVGISDLKENQIIPASADKNVSKTERLTTIGATKTIPNRAPDGGYTAPVTFAPTQEQFDECTIIDANEDNKKWQFDSGYFKYPYDFNNAADDWCILPAMNLEGGTYKITYTYKTRSDKEDFRMCLGTSTDPASMTKVIMEKTEYSNSTDVTEVKTVELPAGEWHFGLYAFSPKNKFGIYFKDISIVKLDMNRPKGPELSIEADGLDCTLTVTLPTQTLGGETLTEQNVSATVMLDGNTIENGTFSGAPGASKAFDITVPTSGYHTFSATATAGSLTSEASVAEHKFTKKQTIPTPMGYTFEPDEDEFSWSTVINSNDDNSTWQWGNTGYPETGAIGAGTFRYSYSYLNAADDWIILPVYDGTQGGAHKLTFNLGTKYNTEKMEVCMAYEPTVEALSQNVIWENDNIKLGDGFEMQEAIFPTEAGKNFYIAFHAKSPSNAAYIYVQAITVDLTDGSAPAAASFSDPSFDGGNGTISLTLPLKNVGGEDMDANTEVYAEVTLDGQAYGEAVKGKPGEVKTISFTDLSLGSHTVTATTYILDGQNQKVGNQKTSFDFKCRIGSSFFYTLPLDLQLNSTTYDNFLIVNANEDSETWTAESEYFNYKYHSSNPADDWFITPAIEITEPDKLYDIAFEVRTSSYYKETFEVYIGKEQSVAGMTTEIMGNTEAQVSDWTKFDKTFSIAEPGKYYIGVHCTSEKNLGNVRFKSMTLAVSEASNDCPAAVTELEGDGLETGELFADISFKFPTQTIAGETLDAETALTATISSSEASQTVEGKPGEAASVRLACPSGKSKVTVKVASEIGTGEAASIEVNCGLDRPSAPVITAVTVSEDNKSVKIDYEAIVTGVSGGHVNASNMDYYLWEWDADDEDWYQIDVTDQLSMTYEIAYSEQPLTLLTLGLQAYNGLNSGSSMTSFNVVLGKPYTLPMEETFANGALHYSPLALGSSLGSEYAPTWSIVDPSTIISTATSENGGYALYGHTSWNRGDSYIYLPKFSTENIDDAEIEFTSFQHPSACELTLMAATYGMDEFAVLGKVEIPQTTEGWKKFKFTLPETLQNRKWVDARLHVNFLSGSTSKPMIDSYTIRSASWSGINADSITGEANVYGQNGSILISGFSGNEVNVYTPSGIKVASTIVKTDSYSIPATRGIYVVTAGNKTYKVTVD